MTTTPAAAFPNFSRRTVLSQQCKWIAVRIRSSTFDAIKCQHNDRYAPNHRTKTCAPLRHQLCAIRIRSDNSSIGPDFDSKLQFKQPRIHEPPSLCTAPAQFQQNGVLAIFALTGCRGPPLPRKRETAKGFTFN